MNQNHTSDWEKSMDILPPLEASQNGLGKLQGVQRVLRFKEDRLVGEGSSTAATKPSKLPTLQRRASMLAYEPIIVRFVKNGDQFFEGVKINISQRNMRSWDTLLAELTRKIELPAGVRQVYTPDGGHRIKSLSELEHQKTYVCGSTEPFKRINYSKARNPGWKVVSKLPNSDERVPSVFSKNFPMSPLDPNVRLGESIKSVGNLNTSMRNWNRRSTGNGRIRMNRTSQRPSVMRLTSLSEPQEVILKSPQHQIDHLKRSSSPPLHYISKPLALTIIPNGPPPRQSVVVYMNKHAVKSWEQAKRLITENLNEIDGRLRLYKPDGEEIESLSQLWRAGNPLIAAAGEEKFDIEEFLMGGGIASPKEKEKKQSISRIELQPKDNNSLLQPIVSNQLNSDSELQEDDSTTMPTENNSFGEIEAERKESAKIEKIEEDESKDVHPEFIGKFEEGNIIKDTTESEGEGVPVGPGATNSVELLVEKGSDTEESNISADSNQIDGGAAEGEGEGKGGGGGGNITEQPTSDSSGNEGSMLAPFRFPGTSDNGSTTSLTGKRSRKLTLFDDAMSNSSSALGSSPFHVKHRTRSLYNGPLLHPQTPQSELSLGVINSMVDMIIPNNMNITHSTQTLSSTSSRSDSPCIKSRNIAIQTDLIDDELFTTAEPGEEEICQHRHSNKRTKYMSNQNHMDYVHSWTGMTQYHDHSLSEIQLYKETRDKYEVGMIIIEGSFAAVKNCSSKQDKREFLMRVIQRARVFGCDDKIIQELKIMRMMRHENIMTVVDYWENSEEMCMVMEPIEGGDLFDAILHCQHFSEADGMEAIRQLGLALIYLHANRIVHRGVKPENIFLTLDGSGSWIIKLAGFNLATFITEPLTLVCGNQYYQAPEMISGKGYGTKVDVWSVGVIAYILLSGTMPFKEKRKNNLSTVTITTGKFSFPRCYWDNVTSDAKDFIRCLLNASPSQRFSSSQLMQHSWIKKSFSTSDGLSRKLNEYLNTKAKEIVAPVPILTVTALDDTSHAGAKKNRKFKSNNNH